MKVAVDVMGGDYAPVEVIAGALQWIENRHMLFLVGKEDIINEELSRYTYNKGLVKVINATQVIEQHESPAIALRRKKDASILVATNLVKEKIADAVLSCGSTGAQMAAALFILGRMEGIERPPIAGNIPNARGGYTLLMDVGANVDCKPSQLLQFAAVGSAYVAALQGIENPSVALLNNGEEEGKGNAVAVETYKLFKKQENLNFFGNIEGRDIFKGNCEVIICDGFTGNILLKTMEGLVMYLARSIALETGQVPGVFNKLDYNQVGGAPLLGVNGVSIVCHGSSKRQAVLSAMRTAESCVDNGIVAMQKGKLARIIQ